MTTLQTAGPEDRIVTEQDGAIRSPWHNILHELSAVETLARDSQAAS